MRRLAFLAVLPLLAGCHFPQGWHMPRTYQATGSYSTQYTIVYIENHVVGYQGPYVQWAVNKLDSHPEILARMVAKCPRSNCIRVYTRETSPWAGVTGISIGGDRHILQAWVKLDPDTGIVGTMEGTKLIVFHEIGCHGMGGGWTNDAGHKLCYDIDHTLEDIGLVYHNDPG